MLDILLVNPNNRIVSPFAGIEPPLWAGLIASHYKEQGQRVAILDADAMDLSIEETVAKIKGEDARQNIIVVMGNNPSVSSTPKMIVTKKLVENLKDYNVSVTGLHPSALPYDTEEELGVPVLKGKIFEGTPSIPWELLSMDKYKAHNWQCLDGSSRQPYASVYTSLGCPFKCSFCNIHALYNDYKNKSKVWYRDPLEVIKEIDILVEQYKVRNIKFWDELFTLNPKQVNRMCQLLIHRDYRLNIWAYARVDTVNFDQLKTMKKAGINWLAYGFESGCDSVLKASGKLANKSNAIRAVAMTHDAGINIIGNFIFGLPKDTEETMQETLEFAKSLKLEYVNFYMAKSYPGSKIYKGNKDWSSYNQYGQDGKSFSDRAFVEFFTDKGYLYRIKNKFGIQAVEHIDSMLKFGKPVTRSSLHG